MVAHLNYTDTKRFSLLFLYYSAMIILFSVLQFYSLLDPRYIVLFSVRRD